MFNCYIQYIQVPYFNFYKCTSVCFSTAQHILSQFLFKRFLFFTILLSPHLDCSSLYIDTSSKFTLSHLMSCEWLQFLESLSMQSGLWVTLLDRNRCFILNSSLKFLHQATRLIYQSFLFSSWARPLCSTSVGRRCSIAMDDRGRLGMQRFLKILMHFLVLFLFRDSGFLY